MKLYLFLTLAIVISCASPDTTKEQENKKISPRPVFRVQEKKQPKHEGENNQWEYIVKVSPNLHEYTLNFIGKGTENFLNINKIEIFKLEENKPLQVIDSLETLTPIINGNILFVMEDVNFDNYNDLRVVSRSSLSSLPFLYFLFVPETGLFKRNIDYERITSPQVDFSDKEIVSFKKNDQNSYVTEFYKIKNGSPVLVKKVVKAFTKDNLLQVTTYELINNEMVVTDQHTE